MYIHTREWEAAEYVAQNHCQEGLTQVLVARASEAAEAQDYATAESLLLRAHKPETIINHYKVRIIIVKGYTINCLNKILSPAERRHVVGSDARLSRVPPEPRGSLTSRTGSTH